MREKTQPEKSQHQLNVEAFAECAMEHYRAIGDIEAAINEAWRLGSEQFDSYTMREGEKLFREWIAKGIK